MLEELIAVAIAVGVIIGSSYLVVAIAVKYFEWYYTRQENQRRAKYPELFEMCETVAEYNKQCWNYLETYVEGTRGKIDKLLTEMPYMNDTKREEADQELEELREQYCIAKGEYADLEDTRLNMRKKINAYLEEHPEIDWMDAWRRKESA